MKRLTIPLKRFILIPLAAVALFVAGAVAPGKTPVFGPQNSCASVLIEDAQACGSGGYHVGEYCNTDPPVIPQGYPPYNTWQCYNWYNGWHWHIVY